MASQRIKDLMNKLLTTQISIDLDRARLMTDFYRQPSMEPVILRRSKLFAHVLKHKNIYIDKEAVLAGSQSSRYRAAQAFPEVCEWYYDDIDLFDTRGYDRFEFLPGEKEEFRQMCALWKGHTHGAYAMKQVKEKTWDYVDAGIFTIGNMNVSTSSNSPDYPNIFKKGYRKIMEEIQARIDALDDINFEQHNQKISWEGMVICLQAMIDFAHRYADLAEKEAAATDNEEEKERLLLIAENCRQVPENPPKNFHQALQMVWFTHLGLIMDCNGQCHCIGRFDQYMYPFYLQDKKKGYDDDYFVDLIEEFRLKIAETIVLRNHTEAEAYSGNPMWFHLIIGGVKANGRDASNELTDLVLRSVEEIPTKEPCISFRYHNNINRDTFRHALSVARAGTGHPAFYNDNVTTQTLLSLGCSLKDARNNGFCGCVESMVPGKTDFNTNVGYFNILKVLELALHDGYDPIMKKQLGPHTGDPASFESMDDLKEAYLEQERFFMKDFLYTFDRVLSIHAHTIPLTFASCFVEGCPESGKILQQGGAKYRMSTAAITCLANTADSLAAIEQLVFQEKKLTMAEYMHLIDTDFEGNEAMRQMILNRVPKFGNDIDEVDDYGNWIMQVVNEDLDCYEEDARGGRFTTVFATQSYNVVQGRSMGATPDGRKAYTPTADNASPSNGMDINGPTAVIKSLSKIDQPTAQNGILLNQKLDPQIVKGSKGLDIMETIVRTYFDLFGEHIQFNVIDTETLRKAQKDPNEYRSIMVRVAGYSAYFVDLAKDVQENIISRTTQSSL